MSPKETPGRSGAARRPAPAGAEVRLDFVSPLPPVRSGIADYSADLLPHLEGRCDLRLIRLEGQEVSPEIETRWHPAAAERTGEGGRLPLYQLGNNRYHEGVLRLALARPGVATLHDIVLHHLLVESTLGRAELEAYLERLALDHGWVGERVGRARRWGELGQAGLFSLPAHRALVRRQRGVLVHSRWGADLIRESDEAVRVEVVPMAVPLPPPADAASGLAFRRRLGVGEDQPLLGSFGFQTPIKRTDRVIAALSRPELAGAALVIAGEVSEVLDLERRAAEAGVADRVHVTGFLDFAEFQAAIAACDLCVNLRYPTAGETSASLLRVLAVGRPALVSDYAQFAELPDEVVAKVPLGGDETEALAAAAGGLLADRGRLRRMGRAARRHVERHHDPAAAAAAVAAACGALAEAAPPGDAAAAVPAPTSLVWHRVRGELEVSGLDLPWPEGERRRLRIRLSNAGPARWLATGAGAGGLMVEVHWRDSLWDPGRETSWLDLPRDLPAGQSREFRLELRRPPGGRVLVVEPHLRRVAGFYALGGPSWALAM